MRASRPALIQEYEIAMFMDLRKALRDSRRILQWPRRPRAACYAEQRIGCAILSGCRQPDNLQADLSSGSLRAVFKDFEIAALGFICNLRHPAWLGGEEI
jgi:hypothetical protein